MKTVCAFVLFITMPTVLAASAPATQDEAAFQACLDADPSIGWCQQQIDEINRRER
jgi:hypothetical protein